MLDILIYDDGFKPSKYATRRKDIEYYIDDKDCWICISHAHDKDGYTKVNRGGKYVGLHRYVYELEKRDLRNGEVVMHSCDNPTCFNPEHLDAGTNSDNQRDKIEKGRQANGELNGKAKLSEEDVLSIRNDKRSARKLAKIYGVSHPNILDIKHRRTWTYLEDNDGLEKDLEKLISAKVVSVTGTEVHFDNGYVMTIHPFETYVEKYGVESQ